MKITIIQYSYSYKYDEPGIDGYLISVFNNFVTEKLNEYHRKYESGMQELIGKSRRLNYSTWILIED